jgi:hypothetical protein
MINYNNSKRTTQKKIRNENIFRLIPFVSYSRPLSSGFLFQKKRCLVDFFSCSFFEKPVPWLHFLIF